MVLRFMFTSNEPFQLQPQERDRLEQILRTTSLSAGLVRRARVLLLLADGVSQRQIQAQTGMSRRRIQHWKKKWRKKGLDGLLDAPRSGRPKKLTVAKEAAILAVTKERPPGSLTHWSTRRLARRLGLSNVTIMRVWHKAGLQPHRLRRYMASPDPNFEAKAKDGDPGSGSHATCAAAATRPAGTADGRVRATRNGFAVCRLAGAQREGGRAVCATPARSSCGSWTKP